MADSDRSALSAGDSPAYIDAILGFLGDREPLEVLGETATTLPESTRGLTDDQLRAPESPGKWSILEVIWHLADAEIMLGLRYRKALSEPGARYPAIDQDAWVRELGYNSLSLEDGLNSFTAVRDANLHLLRRLKPAQWKRHGIHEERGKETLEHMVRLYAAHDLYHLYQIDRIRIAIGAD